MHAIEYKCIGKRRAQFELPSLHFIPVDHASWNLISPLHRFSKSSVLDTVTTKNKRSHRTTGSAAEPMLTPYPRNRRCSLSRECIICAAKKTR